jgi:hypothetical protein
MSTLEQKSVALMKVMGLTNNETGEPFEDDKEIVMMFARSYAEEMVRKAAREITLGETWTRTHNRILALATRIKNGEEE